MKIKVTREGGYDHRHAPAVVQHFPEGFEGVVPKAIGEAAVAAKAATEVASSSAKADPTPAAKE